MNRIIVVVSVLALVGAPVRTASAAIETPSEYVGGNTVAPSFGAERGRNAEEAAQAERTDLRIDAAVSPSGTLVWSNPLEAVPGPAGLQPALRVTYDSGADNGLLGPGFELGGLPAIVRVPGTDGGATANAEPRGRIYDGHDSFAFAPEGFGTPVSPQSRLVANANGDAYHTASEMWWQFTAHGNCGVSAFAPCAWVAEDGQGNRYVFGNSSDSVLWSRDGGENPTLGPGGSRGVAVWALSHIQDKHGNMMFVRYLHDDRFMLYPDEIRYGCPGSLSTPPRSPPPPDDPPPPPMIPTPGVPAVPTMGVDPDGATTPSTPTVTFPAQGVTNPWVMVSLDPPTPSITIEPPAATPACTSGRSVRFTYDTREDLTAVPSRYDRRLSAVTMYSRQQAVRSYAFGYEEGLSPIGKSSRLSSITEVGDDQLSSRPLANFVWSDGTSLDMDTKQERSWSFSGEEPVLTRSGDVNGDGKADIVRLGLASSGRTVSYALGQDAPVEQSTAPLGPTTTLPFVDGDHDHWSAAIVDVDVDGYDDVVMWGLSLGTGEMALHMGSEIGLQPAKAYPYNAELAAFAGAGHSSRFYIARVADVNGDQVPDMVFTNRHENDSLRIAYALGSEDGLGPLNLVHGATVVGVTEVLPPIINDVDGNGIDDVIMSFVRTTGVTTQVFRGTLGGLTAGELLGWAPGVDMADCPGGCPPGEATCACVGLTPFQSLRTDINGDGVGDVTLAYTGEQRDTTMSVSKPFGRNIQTWLGQTDFDQLPKDAVGRINDDPVRQILDPAGYPYNDLNAPNYALWEHHSADVNGDGFSDVVSVYTGIGGARAAFSIGTPTGDLSAMVTVSECAAASDHPEFGAPCSSWADGDHSKHRWHSMAFDADADGYDDLLRYYAGSNGRVVDVSWGSRTGLSKFERLVKGFSGVTESSGHEADVADAVSLLMPDLNGDGRPDVVLASHDELLLVGSDPGTPAGPAHPNLLTQIRNGHGGVVDVEYENAARLPGAIDTAATACGGATGSECGTADREPRPLVVATTQRDGRGEARRSTYAYRNGRYYPGPVIVDLARTRPHERADLLFETVERTDAWNRRRTLTRYDQSADLNRRPIEVVESAAIHQAGGGYAGHGVSRRIEFEFDRRSTPFGTTAVELVNRRERTFEWNGFLSSDVSHAYAHGTHGGIVRDTECADGKCIETEFGLEPPTVGPGNYRVQRVLDEKKHVPGHDNVITWMRYDYAGDVVEDERALLCEDSQACPCYLDADQCVGSGQADWVTLRGTMVRDANGNLTSVLDGEGNETRYEYDADFETFVSAIEGDVRRADGSILTHRREMTYDSAGRLEDDTDENGNITTTRYDALGRVDEVEYPNGRLVEFSHLDTGDPALQRTRVEYETNSTTGDRYFEESYFDGMGRVHMRRRTMGDDVSVQHWGWDYASDHEFELVSDPYLESEVGERLWTETTRDPRGRVLEVRRHRGALFDENATMLGVLERYLYATAGFAHWTNAAQVDSDGTILGEDLRWRSVSTDSRGHITSIAEDGGIETTYFYDDALRPHLVWGRHASTSTGPIYDETFLSFSYDTLGRKVMVHDTHGLVSLQYDDNGNVLQSTDANGETIDWTYDEMGRVINRSTATTNDDYVYDQGVNGTGRLYSVTGAWGTRSFPQGYDVEGRPNALRVHLSGLPSPFTETYQYELSGRMTRRTLPDSTVLGYGHDGSGMLRTVTVDQSLYAEFDQYDAHGSPAFRETPAAITTFEYDADHRLSALRAEGRTGELLQDYGYEYDAAGEVRALVDRRAEGGSSIPGDASWTYGYDKLGQLIEAEDGYGNAFDFAYDARGNLRQKGDLFFERGHRDLVVRDGSVSGPVVSDVTLDDMGRILSKLDGGQWQYGRDPLGRLTDVEFEGDTLMTADYGHDDRRVRRTEHVGGVEVTTWYVTPNFEVQHSSDQPGVFRATKRVDAGSMGMLATITDTAISGGASASTALAAWGTGMAPNAGGAPEGVYFVHGNHLGSTDVVASADGEPVSVYATSPWGERTSDSHGFDVADREFTGQVRDEAVGLLYYQARYYDPLLGQFMEADYGESREPYIPGGIFDPRGLNRHAYVFNNPVRYTDPSGHDPSFWALVGRGGWNSFLPIQRFFDKATAKPVARANRFAETVRREVKVDAAVGGKLGPYKFSCDTASGCSTGQDAISVGDNKSLTGSKSVKRGVLRASVSGTVKPDGVSVAADVGVGLAHEPGPGKEPLGEVGATVGTSVSATGNGKGGVTVTVSPRARASARAGTEEANLFVRGQASLENPPSFDLTPDYEGFEWEKPMP